MWTDATAVDALATTGSQRVAMRRLHPFEPLSGSNPLVPVIEPDYLLSSFASLIIYRNAAALLRSSSIDFTGTKPHTTKAEAFEVVDRNATFKLDATLQAMIAGRKFLDVDPREPVSTPDASGGVAMGVWAIISQYPSGVTGVLLPAMENKERLPYSPSAARASTALLNELRAVRQAESVAVDAGLAATCAAAWTAKRAELLAQAQSLYPERGYV